MTEDRSDWMAGPLCPFGLAGDEPMGMIDGKAMGVREAVWRGLVPYALGLDAYPTGLWSVVEAPQ